MVDTEIKVLIRAAGEYARWEDAARKSVDPLVIEGFEVAELALFHAKQNLKDAIFRGER